MPTVDVSLLGRLIEYIIMKKDVKKDTKPQATSNAQNIQSKLLGTNVSEINIEKLRALSA